MKIINSALHNGKNESLRAIASQIKKSCDLEFGKYWHCIIGKNFGSDISHGKFVNNNNINMILIHT